MTQKLRVGVIGAGAFASLRHLPDLTASPEAEVVAVCRRDPEALGKIAAHFGVPHRFTDYERLLDEAQLDAVVVTSPHGLHFEHIRAALRRDLAVLTDKPLAVTVAEAEELRELAVQRRRPLLVAFGPPYSPAWRYFRSQIARGAIGSVQLAQHYGASNADSLSFFGRGTFPADFPVVVPPTAFRASAALGGGGYLQDVGSHILGGILIATGLRPIEVSATMDSPEVDLRAAVTVRCAGGALITTTMLADATPTAGAYLSTGQTVLLGTEGGFQTAEGGAPPLRLRWGQPAVPVEPEALPPRTWFVENLIGVLRGRQEPLVPLDAAVDVVRVIAAAYRSARDRCPVRLP
jgi:predicted dehydrogenase